MNNVSKTSNRIKPIQTEMLSKKIFSNIPAWRPAALGLTAVTLAMLSSCANIGTPSGGPRDEDPPRFLSANPPAGSLNVDKERMTLTFDELINVKDAFQKVVVSPTSKSVPRVSSQGRRVTIDFDSLAPNTTYTVDFADAIEDNNEGNKLQGFTYTFSTGPQLDSLRISGRVLGARNLEPQQGMIVGVHENMSDTAFSKTRLLRVAKTDDRGQFTIRGLAPGKYRVFALEDKDNDYAYSSPEEDLAFYDFVVEPSWRAVTAIDSIYNPLTGQLDSVTERTRTQFLPNDIVLRSFNSEVRQQYLAKSERLDSTRVYIKFNTRSDSLPRLSVIGHPDIKSPGILEASERLDSLVWWLTPELMRTDSLQIVATYTRSDQNLVKSTATDTLGFFTKKLPTPKKPQKKKRISYKDSIAAITTAFKMISPTTQDVHLPLEFEIPAPLSRFDTGAVHLSFAEDSVYRSVPEKFSVVQPDSLQPRKYMLDYPWEYGGKYRLEIDSLAATDIFGKPTLPLRHDFTVKQTGDYCSVLFHITGLPSEIPAFVELLNSSDAVQRTAPVEKGNAFFPFLTPGRFYARIILDLNGNGEYDTGNYDLGLQPELAYYYPKAINVKKNWDKEENWALFDTPVDMMKPAAVTKNKPASDKRRRDRKKDKEEEEEEDEIFDPTRNPFDPNDRGRRRTTVGSY